MVSGQDTETGAGVKPSPVTGLIQENHLGSDFSALGSKAA